nr:helix-turn-helix domain-containing protein [Polaribacter irgensii]
MENNENEPRGTTLNLICKALGIKTEDILIMENKLIKVIW